MAKGYKKALVRSQKECKKLRVNNRQLKRELFMEIESTKHDIRLIKKLSNDVDRLKVKVTDWQAASLSALILLLTALYVLGVMYECI